MEMAQRACSFIAKFCMRPNTYVKCSKGTSACNSVGSIIRLRFSPPILGNSLFSCLFDSGIHMPQGLLCSFQMALQVR
jgi:hypothetical protein